jgi:hypothetical protein
VDKLGFANGRTYWSDDGRNCASADLRSEVVEVVRGVDLMAAAARHLVAPAWTVDGASGGTSWARLVGFFLCQACPWADSLGMEVALVIAVVLVGCPAEDHMGPAHGADDHRRAVAGGDADACVAGAVGTAAAALTGGMGETTPWSTMVVAAADVGGEDQAEQSDAAAGEEEDAVVIEAVVDQEDREYQVDRQEVDDPSCDLVGRRNATGDMQPTTWDDGRQKQREDGEGRAGEDLGVQLGEARQSTYQRDDVSLPRARGPCSGIKSWTGTCEASRLTQPSSRSRNRQIAGNQASRRRLDRAMSTAEVQMPEQMPQAQPSLSSFLSERDGERNQQSM